MFTDPESVSTALRMLHPEIAQSVTPEQFDDTVSAMLEKGVAAEQIGRASLKKIFASFICDAKRYENIATFADYSDEQVENEWLRILRKLAKAGFTADELAYFTRQVQFELLDDVCLSLDNNVTYDHVPYSEFGVYLLNTHTNEPEVLIDGLHECVESIKEEVGHQSP